MHWCIFWCLLFNNNTANPVFLALSQFDSYLSVLGWFSNECNKTKTNESNHSGKSQSQTTHNIVLDQPINNVITCTIVPDIKHGKTGESELYLVFGCTSDGMKMWFKFLG